MQCIDGRCKCARMGMGALAVALGVMIGCVSFGAKEPDPAPPTSADASSDAAGDAGEGGGTASCTSFVTAKSCLAAGCSACASPITARWVGCVAPEVAGNPDPRSVCRGCAAAREFCPLTPRTSEDVCIAQRDFGCAWDGGCVADCPQ